MLRREPSGLEEAEQKDVAEQLGGQWVARGRRVSRMAPGAERAPEGLGGRRVTRTPPNSEQPERLQVAWVASTSQEWASPS